ncbi:hypothetical protein [Bacillus atrophaeus]|uniref:hypothetical protein n=1 Tax=Bacillus atrophaeus TaxID=1452 RepID=UPI002E1DDC90
MHARNAKMIVAIGVQKSVEIVLMLVVKLAAAKILLLFWDTEDLIKNTKMCWNTIQEKFFDSRFPKRKVE